MEQRPTGFPATLEIDYPDRELNRLTTFFRPFTVIPIMIILGLVSGSTVRTTSDTYLLDLVAPTVEHDLNGVTSVAQNGTLSYDITAKGGSAGSDFSLKALATGPANLESSDGPFTFGAAASGIAPDNQKAVGLVLGCEPLGNYTSDAELTAVDLCGSSWGAINSSTDPADQFEIAQTRFLRAFAQRGILRQFIFFDMTAHLQPALQSPVVMEKQPRILIDDEATGGDVTREERRPAERRVDRDEEIEDARAMSRFRGIGRLIRPQLVE